MKLSKDELEALLLCVDDSCATYCDYYMDCRQDCLVRSLRGKAELGWKMNVDLEMLMIAMMFRMLSLGDL